MLKHNKGCLLIDLKRAHQVAFPLCSLVLVENAKIAEDFLMSFLSFMQVRKRQGFPTPKKETLQHACMSGSSVVA